MKKEDKVSYYESLVRNDIVTHFDEMIRRGILRVRESDGKLEANHRLSVDTPWIHVRHLEGLYCDVWHKLTFGVIGKSIGKTIVPRECQQCWKVVVRPRTVKELFELLDLQYELNYPAKCGIELRDYVHGLYGGYFYTRSFEAGMKRWKQVRNAVDEKLGKEVSVILKRGCTEFEMSYGDSKYYQLEEWQNRIEDLVREYITHDDVTLRQPKHVHDHIKRRWIEFAYDNGDPTYALFTDGKPLAMPLRTYHHLFGCNRQELADFWSTEDTIEEQFDPRKGKEDGQRKVKVHGRNSRGTNQRSNGQKDKDKIPTSILAKVNKGTEVNMESPEAGIPGTKT